MRWTILALAAILLSCGEDKPEQDPGTLRIGAVMLENGQRFETSGRAAAAGRWELAAYEVEEILELFAADMPNAPLPPDCNDAAADSLYETLVDTQLPTLKRAAQARDMAAYSAAYRDVSVSCNGCHSACNAGFIEVLPTPGTTIPSLDPIAP
jgi:hypothetical protein